MLYYEADVNGDITQKDEDGNDELADSSNVDRIRCEDLVAKIIEGLKDDDLNDVINNIQDYNEKINGKENKPNNDIQIDEPNVNKINLNKI